MKNKISLLPPYLMQSVDGTTLAIFRILFGGIMAFFVFYYCTPEYISARYIEPHIHFSFPLFDWLGLKVWSASGMRLHFLVMGIAAVGISLGLLYKISLLIFFLAYGYMFLLEECTYNNHYYLILLITILFMFMRANARLSLDAYIWPELKNKKYVPFWNIFLLRAQICILYFFGAIAKCNPDWLNGDVLLLPVAAKASYPFVGPYVHEPWLRVFFSYAGLMIDFVVWLLLCIPCTRIFGFIIAFSFHTANKWLWNIGIFHYLMLGTFILFVNPNRFGKKEEKKDKPLSTKEKNKAEWVTIFIFLYIFIQLLIPFRHVLYEGDVQWNSKGGPFSWRIYSRSVNIYFRATVVDGVTRRSYEVNPGEDIHPTQGTMGSHPNMILKYAHFLRDKYQKFGVQQPEVYIDSQMSLNSHPHAPLINPQVDLSKEQWSILRTPSWIMPRPKH